MLAQLLFDKKRRLHGIRKNVRNNIISETNQRRIKGGYGGYSPPPWISEIFGF